MGIDLITTDELVLLAPTLKGTDPLVLQAQIAASSQFIENRCNRKFGYGKIEDRIYYDHLTADRMFLGQPKVLYLKQCPIDYVHDVRLMGFETLSCGCKDWNTCHHVTNANEYPICSDIKYLVNKANGMLEILPLPHRHSWHGHSGLAQLVVRYCGGFKEIPSPIKLACAILVREQHNSVSQSVGMKRERIGDYEYEKFGSNGSSNELPKFGATIDSLILPYQRWGVNGL